MNAAEAFGKVEATEDTSGSLVRRVRIVPEFDCHDRCAHGSPRCRPGSGGWHGIGSRRIYWSVARLGEGAVSMELFVPIYTDNALRKAKTDLAARWEPLGALDLHYGTPPGYLAEYGPKDCDLIDGKCWTDVTFLQSETGYEMFQRAGTEGVWAWLAEAWLPQVLRPRARADSGIGEET